MIPISTLDLFLLTVLAVVPPVLGVRHWQQFLRQRASGSVSRLAVYRSTMLQAWLTALIVLAAYIRQGREPTSMGLQWPTGVGARWALVAITGLTIALLWSLHSARRADQQQCAQMHEVLGPMADFMPRDRTEHRSWAAMSLTAGITEELVFRGYLMWLFGSVMPAAWALVISSLLFGLQHAYQGVPGILRTAIVGAVLCGLYLASGSLLMPIIAHILIDLIQGKTFSLYLRAVPQQS